MKWQPRGWTSLALALALATPLVACRGGVERRLLVVGLNQYPLALDPHYHDDMVTSAVLCNFYEGLVSFSSDMKIEPSLAKSWENVDPNHWRFHLRQGVRFHRGELLRAADVVASFERARTDPHSAIRHHLLGVTRMTALDDLTVMVETDEPRPTLLNRLAFLWVVPAQEARSAEITEPNGTGPYRVVRHDNPDWLLARAWPGWRGLPDIREVKFVFCADTQQLFKRFLAGELDVANQLPEGQLGELRTFSHVRAEPQPRLTVQMLVISASEGDSVAARALSDVRVRRAILLGCDRERLVGQVFRGAAEIASQYVHPAVFGYDPTVTVAPYDPKEARALLVQAGFPNGFDVMFDHTPMQAVIAAAIVEDLAKIGIRVTAHEFQWDQLMARMREGRTELAPFAWSCSTGDAGDFLTTTVHSLSPSLGLGSENYGHFRDARLDSLIEEAERELDSGKRLLLLQAAQRRTLGMLPYLPLLEHSMFLGVSDRVDIVGRYDQWLWIAAYRWRASR
jgi:peptide/nickel transport system substrate-binding protein